MNRSLKTISLDEDAYRRLLAWKRTKGDSFSKVIKRMVPEAGTLGAMAQFVSSRKTSEAQDAVLEAVVDERSATKQGIPLQDTGEVTASYAEICTRLQESDLPAYRSIGQNDLWIAAVAVQRNLPLVTRNQRHFGRIGGLQLIVPSGE